MDGYQEPRLLKDWHQVPALLWPLKLIHDCMIAPLYLLFRGFDRFL